MKKKQIKLKIKLDIKKVLLALFILFFLVPFVISIFEFQNNSSKLEISQAMSDIKAEKVKSISVDENKIILTYKDDSVKSTNKESIESFTDILDKFKIDPNKVSYNIVDKTISDAIGQILGVVLPIVLMAVFFLFIFKSQNKGAQDIFSFGKSKAKLFAKGKQSVTFQDVAGVDDAKKELEEVVDFLKNPAKYRRIGARTPKGVLLFGPAGVGKTLLARAVAGEAGVPFFSMAGSEFMEMLVGVGASRVRDLFVQAKLAAPSIIFIDEMEGE